MGAQEQPAELISSNIKLVEETRFSLKGFRWDFRTVRLLGESRRIMGHFAQGADQADQADLIE